MVSTHLKNISQIGNLPQVGVKIKNIQNHHLDNKGVHLEHLKGWLLEIKNSSVGHIAQKKTPLNLHPRKFHGVKPKTCFVFFPDDVPFQKRVIFR